MAIKTIQNELLFTGRCAFSIDTQVQHDVNNTNIYMRKVEEFFSKNFERTFLAKMHRITPHIQLANLCSFIFRMKQSYQKNNSSLPAHLWLMEHMHEFIQQRFVDLNHNKSADDLLQLMIDAVHSDKVCTSKFISFRLYREIFNRIIYYQRNY